MSVAGSADSRTACAAKSYPETAAGSADCGDSVTFVPAGRGVS
jgi:hypothetical protein